MVKLERNITPIQLTPSFVQSNTEKFKTDGSNVWNVQWLKEALLTIGYEKCCYCECSIKEESKYMEVEHFEDKDNNKDKVLDWDNLLPSCKRCNGSKGTHDVIDEPIINPFIIDPRNELYFRLYKIKGKTPLGISTEEVVSLNDTERAVKKRFEVGEELEKQLENSKERLESYKQNQTTRRRNKLVNLIRELLRECLPDTIYSATCATIIMSNSSYLEIKEYMEQNGLWNDELKQFHQMANAIILEIR